MAKSEQQRQRKLAKKKSKERESKKILSQREQRMASLAGRAEAAASGSVVHCLISTACEDGTGIGTVIFTRRIDAGRVMAALFLVDVFCLGVKDVVGREFTVSKIEEVVEGYNSRSAMKDVRPGIARGFVEAAVNYAKSLGISPHGDYRKISPIWGNIEAEPVPSEYQFGNDGKPFFIAGPYDDLTRQKQILRTLATNLGEGNFDFTIAGESPHELYPIAGLHMPLDNDEEADDVDEDVDYLDEEASGMSQVIDGTVTERHTT